MQFRKRKKKNRHHKARESTKQSVQSSTNNTSNNKEIKENANNNNDTNTDDKSIKNETNPAINDDQTTNNDTTSKAVIENKSNEDEEDEDDDLSFLNKLKETKTIHDLQFQTKDKGLTFEETHEFTSSGLENPDNFRHVKYNKHDCQRCKDKLLNICLWCFQQDPSRDFGESFSSEKIQDDKLKQQRTEWVEKQMRKKLLEQGRVLKENEKSPKNSDHHRNKTTLKEELYALSNKLSMPLMSTRDNDEAGERWLAGMAEYELPLEYKLKNIEQTEEAKKKLLEPKPKHEKIFDIPRNYNQDFTTHHYDRVKTAEHKRRLQETQQRMSMQREKKRRRLMGTDAYQSTSF